MGTSPEKHNNEADKSVGRLLKEGSNGSLARAKETLKDRLYQQMIDEVKGEMEATDEVAQHALEDASTDWDALIQEAKSSLKKQLMQRMIQQAMEEVSQELLDTEQVVAEAMKDTSTHPEALDRIKSAMKERLMAEMLEAAIAEIHDEMGSAEDNTEAVTEDDATSALDEPEAVDLLATVEEEAAEEFPVAAHAEAGDTAPDFEQDVDGQPLIDMHFWNDEEETDEARDPSEPVESVMEASEELDADPDFFQQVVVAELGESSGDGSSAEPIADGTPISFLAGFSMSEALLEETGDGAVSEIESPDDMAVEAEDAPELGVSYFVYGVFASDAIFDESDLPQSGLDPDHPLMAFIQGNLGAIVSVVDEALFGEDAIKTQCSDRQWKEASELAFDGFLEDCALIKGFVPVPFGSVYSSEERLQQALEQADTLGVLGCLQDRSDWTVRVYRNRDTLHQRIMERSQTVQDIMVEIKSKPKGEAAAIKKRMVATIQDEISETTDRCTSDVHELLLAHVDDARLGTPDRSGHPEKGEGIFDATYLVHKDKEFDFHTDLEALCQDYMNLGFQMDIIGPVAPVLHLPTPHPASS